MPDDFLPFLLSAGFLILYLFVSAATEMGTRLPPWMRSKPTSENNTED